MVTLSRLAQRLNAQSSINITEDGMVYAFAFFPAGYLKRVSMALSNKTPSTLA
jgi:hypothetical protein